MSTELDKQRAKDADPMTAANDNEKNRLKGLQVEYKPRDNFLITAFVLRTASPSPPNSATEATSTKVDKETQDSGFGKLAGIDDDDGNKRMETQRLKTERLTNGQKKEERQVVDGKLYANDNSMRSCSAGTPNGEFSILRHLLENGKRQHELAKPCLEYFRKRSLNTRVAAKGNVVMNDNGKKDKTGCPFFPKDAEGNGNFGQARFLRMALDFNFRRYQGSCRMHPYANLGGNHANNGKKDVVVLVDLKRTGSVCSSNSSSSDDQQDFEVEKNVDANKPEVGNGAEVFDDYMCQQDEPLNLSGH